MKVLVTGATGFVGSRLVPALVDAGHEVTVLARDAERYDGPDVRVVEGDLLEPGSFEGALDAEAAYYLVHSMRSGDDFEERDRRAARNFVDAADDAGIERVIYLGGSVRSATVSRNTCARAGRSNTSSGRARSP